MIYSLTSHDLDFEHTLPIRFYSERGVPQTYWAPVGMPRIPQNIINGVFYLYRDRADALAGLNPGGTGFIVQYTGVGVFSTHYYGVTNHHVACRDGFSVIRINTKDGGTDIIDLGPEQWEFLPGRYDVAVVPLTLDPNLHEIAAVGTHMFEEPDSERRSMGGNDIGVGEDVFMVGLFVDHDGVTVNVPSARFGNISMMPNPLATIEQPTGYKGISFVVDMHSRTGFSGSPVYVFRTFGSDLTNDFFGHEFESLIIRDSGGSFGKSGRMRVRNYFKLLGIHWGQFPERWELSDKSRLEETRKAGLITDGRYVEGMSGMTCVIPAWQICEVLDMPKLKGPRDKAIAEAEHPMGQGFKKPKAESVLPDTDENPNHKADFDRLLNKAVKRTDE
jgi:hypothetical protein